MSKQAMAVQPAVDSYGTRSMTAVDMQAQINLMVDVMTNNMVKDTHYGVIPGTKVPSLYKPGAEKLMSIFRLVADPEVEDLGENGEAHYRVKVKIYSASGNLLGAGIGECSSQEEKYSWRRAVCKEEFEATPVDRRRVKFSKYQGKVEETQQVRTNPADVRNTCLKMAKKRGLVDGVLTVTAASDLFTQDVEDLPPEYLEEHGHKPSRASAAAVQQATPPDSPERDAAIAECKAAAAKGSDSFRAFWKAYDDAKRKLVLDRMADFKAIAESADTMLEDKEAA